MAAAMVETVRARLTLWFVSVLAVALFAVGSLIYALLARALYQRIDESLHVVVEIAMASLHNDLNEGQDTEDAARSTAAELASNRQMVSIYDAAGRLLAAEARDEDLVIELPPVDEIPFDREDLSTVHERNDVDDRHRLAMRRVTIAGFETTYIIVAGRSLEPTDEELESLRRILAYVGPIALVLAGIGGWFMARQSLSPVVAMADRARQIGVGDLAARLPVANPRDELGHLAETFNQLLGRLEASLNQQRQFMADASHELRTPVATARTAASVALQQLRRDEADYRQALEIIEDQTTRLSRIVDDMFTLARADAGNVSIQHGPMYLDEVVEDVARSARVLAATRAIEIAARTVPSASFLGDEDLIRRLIGNLVDNAIRHAPANSTVTVDLRHAAGGYEILVIDSGPGIPPEIQPRIFERFFRLDAARTYDGGAGLGLALARWIAREHGGEVRLTESSDAGTIFTVELPSAG